MKPPLNGGLAIWEFSPHTPESALIDIVTKLVSLSKNLPSTLLIVINIIMIMIKMMIMIKIMIMMIIK